MKFSLILLEKSSTDWLFLTPGFHVLRVKRYMGGWAIPLEGEYVHFSTLLEALSVYSEAYNWGRA